MDVSCLTHLHEAWWVKEWKTRKENSRADLTKVKSFASSVGPYRLAGIPAPLWCRGKMEWMLRNSVNDYSPTLNFIFSSCHGFIFHLGFFIFSSFHLGTASSFILLFSSFHLFILEHFHLSSCFFIFSSFHLGTASSFILFLNFHLV